MPEINKPKEVPKTAAGPDGEGGGGEEMEEDANLSPEQKLFNKQ